MERISHIPSHYEPAETALIILGDAGINFYLNKTDKKNKKIINHTGYIIYCVRGNHEERPENLETIEQWYDCEIDGTVWREPEYPNIRYLMDGHVYLIDKKPTLVIGGAYSVDKYYRLERGWNWFANEQLDTTEKRSILQKLNHSHNKQFDCVLTHTCPERYIPREWFLPMVDQSTVDNGMEKFLDDVSNIIDYKKWYCGHYHGEKTIDNVEFLYFMGGGC